MVRGLDTNCLLKNLFNSFSQQLSSIVAKNETSYHRKRISCEGQPGGRDPKHSRSVKRNEILAKQLQIPGTFSRLFLIKNHISSFR